MEHSATYIELEAMIEKNWIVKSISEFDQQLSQLEQEGQISREEYISLLDLYIGKRKEPK
jgi:hypothetical protein